ncbi:MAG: eukaryotic-like serine/threonine-protein kinase [Solirubrobacteraceae bacterium]|jgi:serine/threonine-protein kinase|nr:eukaryotic-like serine/threonine-protein kinase [Solirubrobacteraceae bacterium]
MPSSRTPIGLPARYRLDGLIATGGMAAVYAAHDTVLDRPVAVKVMAEHLTENTDARRRFEREARAAAALSNHPAVVTIYDVGDHDGRSFIVMERRMAGTVAEVLERGRLDRGRALGWLADVAEAIDAAHARGVVHRDIKPQNLLLDEHDRVAIADFGIATLAHENERVTQTGEVLGSGAYLAPEQARGAEATPASDRYALAVVAHELLTGAPPFTGPFPVQLRAHMEVVPPPAPGLPAAAQDVLAQGLAKAPEERWGSAAGFVKALGAALEAAPFVDTTATQAFDPLSEAPPPHPRPAPIGDARRGIDPVSAAGRNGVTPPRGIAAVPPPPGRRQNRLIAVLAALALALAVGVAIAATGGDDPAPKTTAKSTPKAAHKRKARKATPTPTPTPPPTAVATAPPATPTATSTQVAAEGASASALNARGYDELQRGDATSALGDLSKAVQACRGDDSLDPCGYATYNLGVALVAVGRPSDAIGLFQERLARWPDDQSDTVNQALADACAKAGQSCGGPPYGKAKGHRSH